MKIEDLKLELRGPQTGLSLYEGNTYLATYRSSHECVLDLVYRFGVNKFDDFLKDFEDKAINGYEIEPYVYRGVCSEMFWPTDTVFRYVYYANTISELFEKFEFHEKRALQHDEYFVYGVQGTGIHIFNRESMQYELWIGGKHIKSISDVMDEVKKKGLKYPTALAEEFRLEGAYDVFISHKSSFFKYVKPVYDYLNSKGLKIFLSELSLPALSNADYTGEINKALGNSKNLIVVANSVEDISAGWIKYEWSSFVNEKNSGRKDGNLVTLLAPGIELAQLPYTLRQFEVISLDDYEKVLEYII